MGYERWRALRSADARKPRQGALGACGRLPPQGTSSPQGAPRMEKYPGRAMSTGVVSCHDRLVRPLLAGEAGLCAKAPPLAHRVGTDVVDGTGPGRHAPSRRISGEASA